MKDKERLYSIALQMLPLLRANGHADWAAALEGLVAEYESDPGRVKHSLRGWYGGMGSFNDIVLQTDEGALAAENDVFDQLRHELWEVCQSPACQDGSM